MRILFFICFVFLLFPGKPNAQDLSTYKYVIVPKSFGFTSEEDKYQLNSLSVFLFEKYGFEAVMEGEPFPEGLKNQPCSALYADVLSDSGMFSFVTKVKVVLKNCNQQTVFESKEGRSRLKKYKFAYQEALRDAFSSVESLDHVYKKPSDKGITRNMRENEDISRTPGTIPPEKPGAKNVLYRFKDSDYQIFKKEEKWILKEADSRSTEAYLYQTNNGNFVFRSEKINGTAYFDENRNLVVEYFDEDSGSMEKVIYEKKD